MAKDRSYPIRKKRLRFEGKLSLLWGQKHLRPPLKGKILSPPTHLSRFTKSEPLGAGPSDLHLTSPLQASPEFFPILDLKSAGLEFGYQVLMQVLTITRMI